jgi:F-type H+-transporting ATPase subunit b
MKKLVVVGILLAWAGVAAAQPAEEPEKNQATTRDAAGDDARKEGPGKAHEGEHIDPSTHFNFFDFSWRDKDEFGGKFGDGKMQDEHTGVVVPEEEPMSAPFILMVLNFVVFLAILAKWGWPAASKLAADRHDQIKNALEEAATLRKKAADKLAEYETRIKDLDSEIKKLVDGVRADAAADRERILAAAATQAAQMKKDAEQRIAAEIELARTALTREVAAASVAATEKLLREKVTAADQQKLVASFISDIGGGGKEAR